MASPRKLFLCFAVSAAVSGVAVFFFKSYRVASDANAAHGPQNSAGRISQELATEVERIEAGERQADETIWAREILAEECGRTIETWWDSLNAASNKLNLLGELLPVSEVVAPNWKPKQILPHGIQLREPTESGSTLAPGEWRQLVAKLEQAGWQPAQLEFRQNRFETDDAGRPARSRYFFSVHAVNSIETNRAVLEGDLLVEWGRKESSHELTPVLRIDGSQLALKSRTGEPPFKRIFHEGIEPRPNSRSIDPLILYDLDGDGSSEIILAGQNLVYHRGGENRYVAGQLCSDSPGAIDTAVIADFDGDGAADFLCLKYEGLFLFKGSARGVFDVPGRRVFSRRADWKSAMVLTCGDVERDGDLDVFIGQYKEPYEGGAVPTPYYDANNGYPCYLLLNDGRGNFSDGTEAAGLGVKRLRRTYSASFVDLDADGHLDLVVVSDFAGVDLYRNDGRGRFTEMTSRWLPESHAFGMAHALADLNSDGRLDLLMIGMTSPAVERLNHLKLERGNVLNDQSMRTRMTFGNRLYLGRAGAGFEQTSLSSSIARSGWSWGCSIFDFDNDGFPDAYIANGLESNRSVRDYESEYWLHDRYVGKATEEPAPYIYFKSKFARTRGRDYSYGGYEKNRLYLNRSGASFLEIGHLAGVALEQDCRNVVTDDLDGDGRLDLLVTTLEIWPEAKQTLSIYKNQSSDAGNWIGFRFREEGGGRSPVGLRVTLQYGNQMATRQLVTGDSHRSQHANTIHFGLGKFERVDRAEIRWANGETLKLDRPSINRYHSISASEAKSSRASEQNR